MKGLILKDAYTVFAQAKFFLIVIMAMALMQNDFLFSYAVFYAAVLPVTALGYDERARWNNMADMMPYTAGQIVGSKYIMGYAAVAVTALLALFGKSVGVAWGAVPDPDRFMAMAFVICGALVLEAVMLPAIFWLGVERGWLLFVVMVVCGIIGFMTVIENVNFALAQTAFPPLLPCAALLTAAVNAVSYQISKILYKRKK